MVYAARYNSPVGVLTLAGDDEKLLGLWMEGQKYFGGAMAGDLVENDRAPVFARTRDWLDRYFAGERPEASALPLAPLGSDFRRAVWERLCRIPYGEVVTYGEIARDLANGSSRAASSGRAVGGAVGRNPISIIIPCHRVVGAGESLTGYAGGLERKIKLLALEGVDVSRLHAPARSTVP